MRSRYRCRDWRWGSSARHWADGSLMGCASGTGTTRIRQIAASTPMWTCLRSDTGSSAERRSRAAGSRPNDGRIDSAAPKAHFEHPPASAAPYRPVRRHVSRTLRCAAHGVRRRLRIPIRRAQRVRRLTDRHPCCHDSDTRVHRQGGSLPSCWG